mmetsp:Transcript_81204/g.220034  ORF Transcript_81204/g.220034 Transcript_81204/m.220034 type:complete len:404 (+) Transcript_81204:700-1911(+)
MPSSALSRRPGPSRSCSCRASISSQSCWHLPSSSWQRSSSASDLCACASLAATSRKLSSLRHSSRAAWCSSCCCPSRRRSSDTSSSASAARCCGGGAAEAAETSSSSWRRWPLHWLLSSMLCWITLRISCMVLAQCRAASSSTPRRSPENSASPYASASSRSSACASPRSCAFSLAERPKRSQWALTRSSTSGTSTSRSPSAVHCLLSSWFRSCSWLTRCSASGPRSSNAPSTGFVISGLSWTGHRHVSCSSPNRTPPGSAPCRPPPSPRGVDASHGTSWGSSCGCTSRMPTHMRGTRPGSARAASWARQKASLYCLSVAPAPSQGAVRERARSKSISSPGRLCLQTTSQGTYTSATSLYWYASKCSSVSASYRETVTMSSAHRPRICGSPHTRYFELPSAAL